MCGNASRCVAKYVYERGLTKKTELLLQTDSGVRALRLDVQDGAVTRVRVDMGAPVFDCAQIPCLLASSEALRVPVEAHGQTFDMTALSMGNPHAVIVLDEPVEALDLRHYGPAIETNPAFPDRTNVEFVNVLAPDKLRMRVWERGSGVTLACGTGACAALAAAHRLGLTRPRARVLLDGGELDIEIDEETGHILMTGPAEFVFDGEI